MDPCTLPSISGSKRRSRAEKTDFLLEQVRLCIASNDWLTAENNSRKISTRWFDSADEDEKPEKIEGQPELPTPAPKHSKVELKLR